MFHRNRVLAAAVLPVAATVISQALAPQPTTTVTETTDARKKRLKRERDARYRLNKRNRDLSSALTLVNASDQISPNEELSYDSNGSA